jgi:hypothetical protein
MKKLFTVALIAIAIVLGNTAEAQVKSNVVKTSLTAPLIKTYVFAYERVLNEDMSLQLGFNYFAGWKIGDSRLNGFSVTPEFRYYLSESKMAPSGAFIAPFVRYGSTGIKSGEVGDVDFSEASISLIGGGLLIGTQRLFKDVISLEAFIGPAYYKANVDVETGTEEDLSLNLVGGWSVRLGVTIGFAF